MLINICILVFSILSGAGFYGLIAAIISIAGIFGLVTFASWAPIILWIQQAIVYVFLAVIALIGSAGLDAPSENTGGLITFSIFLFVASTVWTVFITGQYRLMQNMVGREEQVPAGQ